MLGDEGVTALGEALKVNASLTSCNVLRNEMDVAAATSLVEAVKEKNISLCGITPDQTTANFTHKGLKPPDAILLSSDLSKAGVSASLTSLNLSSNELCGIDVYGRGTYTAEGTNAIAKALAANASLTSLDLTDNELGAEGATSLRDTVSGSVGFDLKL